MERVSRGLTRLPGPFALAVSEAVFDPVLLARLEGLFAPSQGWVRHQDHFYRCFIAEVDGQIPESTLQAIRQEVAEVLGLPLVGPVRVTAQRMEPGDGSDRHTDQPQAGYEAARLVVQLDRAHGGRYRAFDGDQVWQERAPLPNGAVAFELCSDSHHDVTACESARRTVVFHFWHQGNPIDAREELDRLLGSMSFADLPAALDPVMVEAEATHPEELSRRAALAAYLLTAWGVPEQAVVAGYCAVVAGAEPTSALALAQFLVSLHLDGFDRALWERLSARWAQAELPASMARWRL